jgi:6-phosphogluconolactonase (cycloisomerase 2 family)
MKLVKHPSERALYLSAYKYRDSDDVEADGKVFALNYTKEGELGVINSKSVGATRPHSLDVSPDARFVHVPVLGKGSDDKFYISSFFIRDSDLGLVKTHDSDYRMSVGQRRAVALAFHPSLNRIYTSNYAKDNSSPDPMSSVSAYTFNEATGDISHESQAGTTMPIRSYSIKVDSLAEAVYTVRYSNTDVTDSIVRFSLQENGRGFLDSEEIEMGSSKPYDLAFSPNEKILYTSNRGDNSIGVVDLSGAEMSLIQSKNLADGSKPHSVIAVRLKYHP